MYESFSDTVGDTKILWKYCTGIIFNWSTWCQRVHDRGISDAQIYRKHK